MTFAPTPKQSLFLWKMICAETPELRQPLKSKARPELHPSRERKPLVDNGFLELVPKSQGRQGECLVLTDRAWKWASETTYVEIMQSNSRDGAITLQGLLRALVPFLRENDLSLADLIHRRDRAQAPSETAATNEVVQSSTSTSSVESRIRKTCRELSGRDSAEAIRLSALRAALPGVSRTTLDTELRRMQDAGSVALYRDDNSARVTADDTRDALMVGDEPRHLLYLKG